MVWEILGTIISFGSFPACILLVRNSTFLIFRAQRCDKTASLSLRYYSTNRYVDFLMRNITQVWELLDALTRFRVAFVMKSYTAGAATGALLYLIQFPKIRTSKSTEIVPFVHHYLFSSPHELESSLACHSVALRISTVSGNIVAYGFSGQPPSISQSPTINPFPATLQSLVRHRSHLHALLHPIPYSLCHSNFPPSATPPPPRELSRILMLIGAL